MGGIELPPTSSQGGALSLTQHRDVTLVTWLGCACGVSATVTPSSPASGASGASAPPLGAVPLLMQSICTQCVGSFCWGTCLITCVFIHFYVCTDSWVCIVPLCVLTWLSGAAQGLHGSHPSGASCRGYGSVLVLSTDFGGLLVSQGHVAKHYRTDPSSSQLWGAPSLRSGRQQTQHVREPAAHLVSGVLKGRAVTAGPQPLTQH